MILYRTNTLSTRDWYEAGVEASARRWHAWGGHVAHDNAMVARTEMELENVSDRGIDARWVKIEIFGHDDNRLACDEACRDCAHT